jgi:hypothetical protein
MRSVQFLAIGLVLGVTGFLSAQPAELKPVREDDKAAWFDIRSLNVEGRGWKETAAPFDRLPAKAEKTVRKAVWDLSRHSAGLCVRFITDSPSILARWSLTSANLAMPHMPATGVSGVDLYYRDGKGQWRWLGVGRPSAKTNTATLANGLPAGKREYLIYLPLYNGVSSVEIGIAKGSHFEKAPDYPAGRQKPIVFYGTSITQGGCASRPGMVHTAILQRRLNCPVINLGFSGNGRMEPEIADLMAEIDAAVYVIDCLPNMNAKDVDARGYDFVRKLLHKRPKTPIVLVEDRSYANSSLLAGPREHNRSNREALKKVFERLEMEKAGSVHYIPGEHMLGDDGEATVDSSHPTDLGFMRQAELFQKTLEPLLHH